jgi:hypothetical protein
VDRAFSNLHKTGLLHQFVKKPPVDLLSAIRIASASIEKTEDEYITVKERSEKI